jgi:polar amino acid transport system substrate-binding protein
MNIRNYNLILIACILGASIVYLWRQKDHQIAHHNDTLVVGTNAEFQPFSFLQNNEIVGFDIDIINEIAKRIGKKIELKNMAFEALIPEIQLGRIHMIAAGMTATPERAQRILFATPHVTGDPLVAVTLTGKPSLKTLQDLEGKTVAVNQGYTADSVLSAYNNITLHRLSSPTISEGLLVLQSGRADAYVAAKSSVMPYFKQQKTNTFTFKEIPGTSETYSIAISKKYPELLPVVEQALASMEQDGTLVTLKKKWGIV